MTSTRYPMRAFYPDGTSVLVQSADEELALKPGWEDTPEAFTPNYQRPPVDASFVPTANAQIMQALSEIEQARLRQAAIAAAPAQVPDSKLAAMEQQFESHALEMIHLKARVGVLETRLREIEELLVAVQSGHVAFDGPVADPFVTGMSTRPPEDVPATPDPEPVEAKAGKGKTKSK